jgi:hypothetical protein
MVNHVFTLVLEKNKKYSTGWVVELNFLITLHQKDQTLLESIQSFFEVGIISKQGENVIKFQVRSNKDLAVIIDHFDKYPLITQKKSDYLLFKQAFNLISRKEHLTREGLLSLVAIKAMMNSNGLPEELKIAFPNITSVVRPEIYDREIKDPNWVAGFTDAEGCFFIEIAKSSSCKTGHRVLLKFHISQHSRDEQLMRSLSSILIVVTINPAPTEM